MEDRALILGCLATPVGLPGSGRLRYGAAMALHGAGEIGDAALEVFRICAAMDPGESRLGLGGRVEVF